jgi:large subunit ribosomal protein L16
MAMMPKRVKYRKQQRGRIKGEAHRGNYVAFGDFGLQALESARIDARQIEAGRIASSHFLKGEGRIWIRIFPHKSVTAKPAEVRMGTGKGDIEYWCAVVRPGTILYEVGGVSEAAAKTALLRTAHKMPVRCRFVQRRHRV